VTKPKDGEMLTKVLPGTDRVSLLKQLVDVHIGLENSRARDTVAQMHNAYLEWANESARMLHHMLGPADLDRLVLTQRYWVLQSMPTAVIDPQGRLLGVEVAQRLVLLEQEIAELRKTIQRWLRPGRFVIADTSLFCHHEHKLEDLQLRNLTGDRDEPIHLIFPMVVIDELDSLKQSGKNHARWRAGHTLAVVDRVLGNGGLEGRLREADYKPLNDGGIPSGEVTIEVVLDPPGHARLPIADDEIIDRAQAIQTLAGRPITFITFDTGQSTRARMAGLQVVKLQQPLSDQEPPSN
jgi:hypothetical protein